MATQREYLEQDLAKSIKEFGPDSASVKHLKAQIASLGTVRHPSQLAALNSLENDKYHAAIVNKRDSAPAGDMRDPKVAASIQDAVDKEIASWDESTSTGNVTPPNRGATKTS